MPPCPQHLSLLPVSRHKRPLFLQTIPKLVFSFFPSFWKVLELGLSEKKPGGQTCRGRPRCAVSGKLFASLVPGSL